MNEPKSAAAVRSFLKHVAVVSLSSTDANRGPWMWVVRTWYLALYLLGCAHWILFVQGGRMALDFHDWAKEAKYLAVLRDAVQRGVPPLHSQPGLLSARFLANPEVNLAPQVLVLPGMSDGGFVLLQILLMFTLGFAGTLLVLRQLRLSPLLGTLALTLFNFNGHITAHLAVGHFQWTAYFLLPLMVLLILRLEDGQLPRHWPLGIAWVLFGLLLLGGYHFALWSAILLAGLFIAHPGQRRSIAGGSLLAFGLGAVRLLPTALDFAAVDRAFISGFPTSSHLLLGLMTFRPPQEALPGPGNPLGWWEIDHFIGALGLAFLAVGLVLRYRGSEAGARGRHLRIDLPLVALVFLSLGPLWAPLAQLPGLDAERVTSRFLILPLVYWIFTAASAWQRWVEAQEKPRLTAGVGWLSAAVIAVDLLQHSRAWRVEAVRQVFDIKAEAGNWSAAVHEDPVYGISLLIGLAITLMGVVYTVYRLVSTRGRGSAG